MPGIDPLHGELKVIDVVGNDTMTLVPVVVGKHRRRYVSSITFIT